MANPYQEARERFRQAGDKFRQARENFGRGSARNQAEDEARQQQARQDQEQNQARQEQYYRSMFEEFERVGKEKQTPAARSERVRGAASMAREYAETGTPDGILSAILLAHRVREEALDHNSHQLEVAQHNDEKRETKTAVLAALMDTPFSTTTLGGKKGILRKTANLLSNMFAAALSGHPEEGLNEMQIAVDVDESGRAKPVIKLSQPRESLATTKLDERKYGGMAIYADPWGNFPAADKIKGLLDWTGLKITAPWGRVILYDSAGDVEIASVPAWKPEKKVKEMDGILRALHPDIEPETDLVQVPKLPDVLMQAWVAVYGEPQRPDAQPQERPNIIDIN